ncbi:MAG: hypothetical protein ACTIJ2_08555 [Sphingobacteriaceae bacterium]
MELKLLHKAAGTWVLMWTAQLALAQTFTGADDLGRVLPQQEEVGPEKSGKQVGLFYFLWQGDRGSPTSETQWDLSKIEKEHPEVFADFHHPNWGGGGQDAGRYYFWGEPIYGYYRGDDYWVHLRNLQLLTDAQVDFLIIDATNRLTYPAQTETLMRAMSAIRRQGKSAPQIVFYTNTASGDAMQDIYDQFYAPNAPVRLEENWYKLAGKPLIIGVSEEAEGRNYAQFFTFRESQWPNEPQKTNGWPWIEFERPQKVYTNSQGEAEIVNVSAAQHPNLEASMGGSAFYGASGNWGRSFRDGHPGDPEKDIFYGYNIQEQWDFALEQNVPFVFITGWNEWIAGKWQHPNGDPNQAHFVDQANPEYSRDIEPTRTAGLKDTYYLQMIGNIRRYKGADPMLSIGKRERIPKLADWGSVPALYRDYVGEVEARNHPGAQSQPETVYRNQTGRNDLHLLKLVATERELGFYCETVNPLTERQEANWMTLWLNVDGDYRTGWNGYDFRVIHGGMLQKYEKGQWTTFTQLSAEVQDNMLLIRVPNNVLWASDENQVIEFKWSDNMQEEDPLDWYVNGDVAPGGRLNLSVRIDE